MRRLLTILLLTGTLSAWADGAVEGRIVKMLPLLLDSNGHDAVSPSLYDRDAYQVYLRQHTNEISAVRYDVLWQVKHATQAKYKLRLELRGLVIDGKPQQKVMELEVKPSFFRHWDSLPMAGDDYKNFGEAVAWRVTLWADDRMLAEQKSFLW